MFYHFNGSGVYYGKTGQEAGTHSKWSTVHPSQRPHTHTSQVAWRKPENPEETTRVVTNALRGLIWFVQWSLVKHFSLLFSHVGFVVCNFIVVYCVNHESTHNINVFFSFFFRVSAHRRIDFIRQLRFSPAVRVNTLQPTHGSINHFSLHLFCWRRF